MSYVGWTLRCWIKPAPLLRPALRTAICTRCAYRCTAADDRAHSFGCTLVYAQHAEVARVIETYTAQQDKVGKIKMEIKELEAQANLLVQQKALPPSLRAVQPPHR